MKFNLDELPRFRDTLRAMAKSSREVADCERLLDRLEKFEASKHSGHLVRSNGKMNAYCVGGDLSPLDRLDGFAIVIEEEDRILEAKIYRRGDLANRAWASSYKSIIREIERKLGI